MMYLVLGWAPGTSAFVEGPLGAWGAACRCPTHLTQVALPLQLRHVLGTPGRWTIQSPWGRGC